jgi:hypothetical protein
MHRILCRSQEFAEVISRIILTSNYNKLGVPKMPSSMVEQKLQLLMTTDSITINTLMIEGIVASKTFEGPDCYIKLVDFLKQSYFADQVIHAIIVVK